MAIRKDLDDMLNSLKKGGEKPGKPAAKPAPPANQRKTKFDDMSVDDLLGVLSGSKSGGASDIAEQIEEEILGQPAAPQPEPVPEPAPKPESVPEPLPEPEPVPEPAPQPEPIPEPTPQPEPVPEPVVQPEPIPEPEPAPKPAKKKRIVITGELPDYEAIRQQELEKDRLERERAEEAARSAVKASEEKTPVEAIAEEAIAAAEAVPEELPEETFEEPVQEEIPAEEPAEEKPKKGFFSKIKGMISSDEKKEEAEELPEETAAEEAPDEAPAEDGSDEVVFTEELIVNESSIDDVFGEEAYAEEQSQLSVDELMEAAIAAVHEEIEHNSAEELPSEPQPEEPAPEEAPQEPAEPAEDSDPVGSMIENMRSDAASAIADIEAPKEEPAPVEAPKEEPVQATEPEEKPAEPEKPAKKGKVTRALENILNEDPAAIMDERTVKTEEGFDEPKSSGKAKKVIYAVLGVIFAALACVGLITVVTKAMSYWGSFTSGETKRDGFVNVIYPAVIMDIESFESPSELTSEQVITAALWSMIMDGKSLDKYQKTFDVVSVPSTDVEAAAVKLFGENIPQLTHTTVGPANSRFYYNEEYKAYNVPIKPATYTYSPDIKSVSKTGSDYTVVVDYIDELPAWMERTSSKSVEFKLTETPEGYQISAMKVLSATGSI